MNSDDDDSEELRAKHLHLFGIRIVGCGYQECVHQGLTRDEARQRFQAWLDKEPEVGDVPLNPPLWECPSCGKHVRCEPTGSDDWGDEEQEEIALGPTCEECDEYMEHVE